MSPQALDLGPLDLGPLDGPPATISLYRPPAPTGWQSTGRRLGPDPAFSRSIRLAGEGQGN